MKKSFYLSLLVSLLFMFITQEFEPLTLVSSELASKRKCSRKIVSHADSMLIAHVLLIKLQFINTVPLIHVKVDECFTQVYEPLCTTV